MSEAGIVQRITWFLYQRGVGAAKPEFLFLTKFGDAEWFKIGEALIKDENIEGRQIVLDHLLDPKVLKSHPKRLQILKMLGLLLRRGLTDERRDIVKFLDQNITVISPKDEAICGPLMIAQRDSDTVIANAAGSAIKKMKGKTQ